jgi:hypothetical protein
VAGASFPRISLRFIRGFTLSPAFAGDKINANFGHAKSHKENIIGFPPAKPGGSVKPRVERVRERNPWNADAPQNPKSPRSGRHHQRFNARLPSPKKPFRSHPRY